MLKKIAKQEKTVRYCLSKLASQSGVVIAEPVGTGKTIIALKIVKKLNKSCLVIVPSRDLRFHWQSKIDEFFKDISKDIEIITKYEFYNRDYNGWGKHIIILDEAHHFKEGTKGFDEFINKFGNSTYKKILLTATPFQLSKYELIDLYVLCSDKPQELISQKSQRIPNIENVKNLKELWKKFTESKKKGVLDFKFWIYVYDYCGRKSSISYEHEREKYVQIWKTSKKELEKIMRKYFVRHKKDYPYRYEQEPIIIPSHSFCKYYFEALLKLADLKAHFREMKLWEICSSSDVFNNYLRNHPDLKLPKIECNDKLLHTLENFSLNKTDFDSLLRKKWDIYSGYEKTINPSEKILIFTQFIKSANSIKRKANEIIRKKIFEEIDRIKNPKLKQLFDLKRCEIKVNKNKQYDVFNLKSKRTPLFLSKRAFSRLQKELLFMGNSIKKSGASCKTPDDLLDHYYRHYRFRGDIHRNTLSPILKLERSRQSLLKMTAWLSLRDYLVGKIIPRNDIGAIIHYEIDEFLKDVLLPKFRKDPLFVHAFARACRNSDSVEEAITKFLRLLDYTNKESILFEVLENERDRIKDIRRTKNESNTSVKEYFGILRCNHYAEVFTSENESFKRSSKRVGHEVIKNCFNSLFCPRLLIMSPIGREGIDFHKECRVAIHYDLWWNPAVIEQRNGRIDRMGSLYERIKEKYPNFKILCYMPYLKHTVDEHLKNRLGQRRMWLDLLLNQKASRDWLASNKDTIKKITPDQKRKYSRYKLDLSPHSKDCSRY